MSTNFIIFSVSLIVIIAIIKVCFASKCNSVNICWGLINVQRDVSLEEKELSENYVNTQLFNKTSTNEIHNPISSPSNSEMKVHLLHQILFYF